MEIERTLAHIKCRRVSLGEHHYPGLHGEMFLTWQAQAVWRDVGRMAARPLGKSRHLWACVWRMGIAPPMAGVCGLDRRSCSGLLMSFQFS